VTLASNSRRELEFLRAERQRLELLLGAACMYAGHHTGGDAANKLIAENSNVMLYGDGGAGKTTLTVDLGCYLAASDDWLTITIPKAVRVLMIENEGPRPLFPDKVRCKLNGWAGSPLEDRLLFWEAPWATFTFANMEHRQTLAGEIRDREVDVVIIGPV